MAKTIEEYTKELDALWKKSTDEYAKVLYNCQEEIIVAFMAKYHLMPDEINLCYGRNKIWVEKKENAGYEDLN